MPEATTFGTRLEGVPYADRPAAYAVVAGEGGTVAAVKGRSDKLFLPGGGALPGETVEETLRREVREELARSVRLVRTIGAATQYFYAADDDRYYKMAAVFFLAEFPDEPTGQGEHDLFWLPLAEADKALFHQSHGWAVRRGLEAAEADTDTRFTVRPETATDLDAIRHVHRLAFGQDDEGRLVDALRDGGYARLSLVAERAGQVVGHVLFSDLPILTDAGTVSAVALAPMAVLPEYQRQGVGSALVGRGLDECRRQGHRIVVVLGHPDFYPRFGFSPKLASALASPFGGEHSWMALELAPGALANVVGRVDYPPPFGPVPEVRAVRNGDQAEWLRMRSLLWPDDTDAEHAREVAEFFSNKTFSWSGSLPAVAVFVAVRPAGGLCGFLEASLRPFADGCETQPVGYIEGWFVDPKMRRRGIGKGLVTVAERWAAAQGCREMASAAHLGNAVSVLAHRALGFEESSLAVHLRKRLSVAAGDTAGRTSATRPLTLLVADGTFAVCRLEPGAPHPGWATAYPFFSITRTADELSVVCPEAAVPERVKCERGWRCLRVAGAIPFSAVGVLASLTTPLAQAGVGVFAVSTFDTDYLLVKAADLGRAVDVLRRQRHTIR